MVQPAPFDPIDKALAAIEADVLPALSALLESVSVKAGDGPDYDARSFELRDMSRQIIDLTRFLAAVTGGPAELDR